MVKPQRVFVTHFLPLVGRNSNERFVDKAPRSRIRRRDMRIVRLPHDVVDAYPLSQLDARLLVPEVDINLPPKNFARFGFNAFLPQLALFPFVITSLQHVTHPAKAGFGAGPFEPRVAIENAREDQIRDQLCGRRAQSRSRNRVQFFFCKTMPFRQRELFHQTRRAMPVHGYG